MGEFKFRLVIENEAGQLYFREYKELPDYEKMFNKIAKSKTQDIRYKCSEYEEIPLYIIQEQKLRLNIREQYRKLTDTELNQIVITADNQGREKILKAEKKRRTTMAKKQKTPPMAQLEQVVPDPTDTYEDIAPIRMVFVEYLKVKDTWFKKTHPAKEFQTQEEVMTWKRRHVLACAQKPTVEIIEPDFLLVTIHGLRNYSKSIRV